MNFETFEKKIDKLKINCEELIEEYDERQSEPFEDCIYDLYQQFNDLTKIQQSADPMTCVQSALRDAIQSGISVCDAFSNLIAQAQMGGDEKGTLQQYFKEISRVYDKNNNDYNIPFCEENLDKLIEMNLKTVVSIAKGYQGLGLSLEELISAGNTGLVICAKGDEKDHKPKYDPSRATLKDNMLEAIEALEDDATPQMILEAMAAFLTYGDVKKKFEKEFADTEKIKSKPHEDIDDDEDVEAVVEEITSESNQKVLAWHQFTKADVIKWIKRNVKNATFNSVAFMWIRAYILIEIDNCSRLVKKPKTEIYNDKLKYGAYKKEITLDIDAPVNDDGNTCFGDILQIEDDTPSDLELSEAYDVYKDGLNKLLDGVKARDRSVFLKKFGIGLPRPMLPKEIADQEGLSIARISQIFQSVVEQMKINQAKYNINPDILFEAARKIN